MYEPGSPSSPLATMNFSSPSAARVNSHFRPAGNPAPPRPRRSAAFDLLEQLLGGQLLERSAQTGPVARHSQHRLVEHADRHSGSAAWRALAGEDALDDVRAGVDHVAVADRRRGVAEAQADGLGERDRAVVAALAELEPEPLAGSGRRARRRWPRSTRSRCRRGRGARRAAGAGRRRRSRRRRRSLSGRPERSAASRRSSSVISPLRSIASFSTSSAVGADSP